MLFSIKMVETFLSDYIISSKTDSARWCIESVRLSDLRDCSDKSILYIGQSADGSIVCINGGLRITVYDAPLYDVFNTVSSKMQYYNDWEKRAIKAAASSNDFLDCVNLFFELFPDFRILVLDPMGRTLYSNSGTAPTAMEPLFLNLIRGIPACHRIALGIKGTHLFWSEHFKVHIIFGNFVFDDGMYLFFSIREIAAKLNEIHIHLSQLAQDIFEKANYRKFDLAGFTPYRNLFLNLLDGKALSHEDEQLLESFTGWGIDGGAHLVLIKSFSSDSFSSKALALSITDKISDAYAFNYTDDIVCLLPEQRFDKNMAELGKIVASVRFRAGVSLRIFSWRDIPLAYRQAELVLSESFSSDSAAVTYCKDCMWKYFITLFSGAGGKKMLHPDIALLKAIDDAKGSQLLDTLYQYLVNCCSMSQTAERMHLHISTLKYRMGKITELISFDPMDYDNRMVFLLSYDMLKSEALESDDLSHSQA